jgi:hypothetical protein
MSCLTYKLSTAFDSTLTDYLKKQRIKKDSPSD